MARAFPDTRAALERMRAGNAAGCATVAALWGHVPRGSSCRRESHDNVRIAERDGGAPVALKTPYRCQCFKWGTITPMNETASSCDMPVASMRKGVVFSISSSSLWYTNWPLS